MTNPYAPYEFFNRIEGVFWFSVAIALPFVVRSIDSRQRTTLFLASIGFFVFGISDFLEAPTKGQVPTTIWILKIVTAAHLLGCRVLYVGWRDFKLTDRWLIFGLFCLASSAAIIFFTSGPNTN